MASTSAVQDSQMLHIYEIVFKSVNNMLKDLKNNCIDVDEKELLKLEVMFLIAEISHCLRVLLEQIRTIEWVKGESLVEKDAKIHSRRKEKSMQERCNEFVVSELFPIKNFRIVVKILLSYYKIFSDYSL